jgi:hypothetical protein
MSRKALEMEYLILYKGSVRGTWKEGSYTEDSEKLVMEGSGNKSISLTGFHKGNLRYLVREASASVYIGPEPVLDIFFSHVSLRGLCPYF